MKTISRLKTIEKRIYAGKKKAFVFSVPYHKNKVKEKKFMQQIENCVSREQIKPDLCILLTQYKKNEIKKLSEFWY